MDKRFARPFGLTGLLVEYGNTASQETLEKVRNMVIHHWVLNKSTMSGKPMNIYQLAEFLEVDPNYVNEYLTKQLLSSRIWNPETQEDIFNAVISQSISWVLEDRLDIQNQVDILKHSQGNTYKPFVSSELTKALGLKLSSSNTLQSVIKGLQGGHSINIFNQNNQTNSQGISFDEAIELISKVISEKPKELYIKEAEYELLEENLPEVVAIKQIGVKTEKEGLTFKRPELVAAMDDYKGAILESDNTHHELRREIELNIDQDSEDPETTIYPH